jgi:hypothetical protein
LRARVGMSKKFYTCLRVAASAKAGRYIFGLTTHNEKLQ